jgi:hypothetical protein
MGYGLTQKNLSLWTPIHPAQLSSENSEYPDIQTVSCFVGLAPHRPQLPTYFFVLPEPIRNCLYTLSE